MKMRIAFLSLILWLPISLFAENDLPEPMYPPRLVNDFAAIFSQGQVSSLEKVLRAYHDSTSTQIYVVTTTDLKGYDISDYAIRLGEKWRVGQKDKDNGILILIKPRIKNERGGVFIATGYGVEHILNDARVGRIIDEHMIPYLVENDYYVAVNKAIEAIEKNLAGEFEGEKTNHFLSDFLIDNLFNLVFFLILFIVLYKLSKNSGGGSDYYDDDDGPTFGGGSFSGGSSSSSSSSGGSFGGGGGGRFGGGGAGRSF